jgi:hypothetical protein
MALIVFADMLSLSSSASGPRSWIVLALVLGVTGAVYLARIGPDSEYVHDSIVYVGGAQGLAEGLGYRLAANVDQPRISFHPPLQSCYLALFWLLDPHFPANTPTLTFGMALLGLGVCACFFVLLSRGGVPTWFAACCTLLVGSSPTWFDILSGCLSDPLFTLLILGAAVLWECLPGENHIAKWLAVGAALGLAYLTRTQAMAIILAVMVALVYCAIARRRLLPLATVLLPVAFAVAYWKVMTWDAAGYGDYFMERLSAAGGWGGYVRNAARMSLDYLLGVHFLDGIAPFLVRLPDVVGRSTATGAVLCAALVRVAWVGFLWLAIRGLLAAWSNRDKVYAWVIVVHMLLIFAWPYPVGYRVLYCTMPFLIRWAYQGFSSLRVVKQAGRRVFMVLTAGWLALASTNAYLFWRQGMAERREGWHTFEELQWLCGWLRREVPSDARLGVDASVPALHVGASTGRSFYLVGAPYFPLSPAHSARLRNPAEGVGVYSIIVAEFPDSFPYLMAFGLVPKRVARSPTGVFEVYQLQRPASLTNAPPRPAAIHRPGLGARRTGSPRMPRAKRAPKPSQLSTQRG